jgi:hypothetical protein
MMVVFPPDLEVLEVQEGGLVKIPISSLQLPTASFLSDLMTRQEESHDLCQGRPDWIAVRNANFRTRTQRPPNGEF